MKEPDYSEEAYKREQEEISRKDELDEREERREEQNSEWIK